MLYNIQCQLDKNTMIMRKYGKSIYKYNKNIKLYTNGIQMYPSGMKKIMHRMHKYTVVDR